jgi:hypothetical protein
MMAENGSVTITTTESSKEYLKKKLEWILDLMDKEHQNANTHAQRNNYQAVIRHELEILRDQVVHSIFENDISKVSDIPF